MLLTGKKEVEQILDRIADGTKMTLQTNEYVLPSKETSGLFRGKVKEDVKHDWQNRLIYGDNLLVMQALLAGDKVQRLPSMRGKIDLIYIDPPFDSKADYRTKVILPSGAMEQKPTVIEQFAYSDTWKEGTVSYLKMMYSRLVLIKELLMETGSIYVHIDWHIGHYVKVIMDDIFGKDNFRNEIIWRKLTAAKAQSKIFSNVKDCILFYSKTPSVYFKGQYIKSDADDQNYPYVDSETGRRYGSFDFTQKGQGAARKFGDKIMEPPQGKHWIWAQENIDEGLRKGVIIFTKNGTPRVKRYLDVKIGNYLGDLWTDKRIWEDDETAPISANSSERINYDTQKPEGLLRRIIDASSPEGGVVADFFAGSGTTGAVAEKLGRRWIMSDIGKPACMVMRKRLIDQNPSRFCINQLETIKRNSLKRASLSV